MRIHARPNTHDHNYAAPAKQPLYRRLPDEILRPAKPTRFLVDVLGTILVVILLNQAAYWFLRSYTTNFGYWVLGQKWALLKRLEAPVDGLVLGDSSCNQGVIPEVFTAELGATVANLCTIGTVTALNDVWMLEDYLARFPAPDWVLIVHVYDLWHRDFPPPLMGQIPFSWGEWRNYSFTDSLLADPQTRSDFLLERYVPLYSQNKRLGGIIRSSLAGQRNPFVSLWTMSPSGFVSASEPRPERVVLDAQDHIAFAKKKAFSLSAVNRSALERILALAETHTFEVYLVNSPVYTGLYLDASFQAYLSAVQTQLQEYALRSRYIHYIPAVKTFPAEQMQIVDHLIVSGAEEYTYWLIDVMQLGQRE